MQECQFSRLKSGLRTFKELKVDAIGWLPHCHLRQECVSKGQTRVGENHSWEILGSESCPIWSHCGKGSRKVFLGDTGTILRRV